MLAGPVQRRDSLYFSCGNTLRNYSVLSGEIGVNLRGGDDRWVALALAQGALSTPLLRSVRFQLLAWAATLDRPPPRRNGWPILLGGGNGGGAV